MFSPVSSVVCAFLTVTQQLRFALLEITQESVLASMGDLDVLTRALGGLSVNCLAGAQAEEERESVQRNYAKMTALGVAIQRDINDSDSAALALQPLLESLEALAIANDISHITTNANANANDSTVSGDTDTDTDTSAGNKRRLQASNLEAAAVEGIVDLSLSDSTAESTPSTEVTEVTPTMQVAKRHRPSIHVADETVPLAHLNIRTSSKVKAKILKRRDNLKRRLRDRLLKRPTYMRSGTTPAQPSTPRPGAAANVRSPPRQKRSRASDASFFPTSATTATSSPPRMKRSRDEDSDNDDVCPTAPTRRCVNNNRVKGRALKSADSEPTPFAPPLPIDLEGEFA